MKRFLIFAVLALAAICSCNTKQEQDSPAVSLTLGVKSFSFTSAGGTGDLSVKSNASGVTAASDASWCKVKSVPSTSETVFKFQIVADANVSNDDRSATVSVKCKDVTETVDIFQLAADGIVAEPTDVSIGAEGGTFTVKLSANGNYEIKVQGGWLEELSTRASMSTSEHSFIVRSNPSSVAREGRISFSFGDLTATVKVSQAGSAVKPITASAVDIAAQMYPGWNLGNTMEGGSSDSNLYTNEVGLKGETAWQGTLTSQKLIDYIRSLGFRSIRIPCDWMSGHIVNAETYEIDPAWMDRVQEIVDYCISDGIYVILNDHHDGGWVQDKRNFKGVSESDVELNCKRMKAIWSQIAGRFRDYDEHLLFAGLNEPDISGDQKEELVLEQTAILVRYEKAFIEAVRATGGNNANRILVVQAPSTSVDLAAKYFDIDQFHEKGRLMLEVHYYSPYQFCLMEKDESWGKVFYYWGKDNHKPGSENNSSWGEEDYMADQLTSIRKFYDNGYPVVLGEYGAQHRFNGDALHDASTKQFYRDFNRLCIDNGAVPYAWDTNYTGSSSMTVVNRTLCEIWLDCLYDGIVEGVASAHWPD